MRIKINTGKRTLKMRIVSFILALIMVFVELPYVGMEASATPTPGDGVVVARSTYSMYMGQTNYQTSHDSNGNSNGQYTGKILPVTVNMYDYLTDAEISNNQANWNNLDDGAYTFWNRYNPYDLFDTKISTDNVSSAATTTSSSDNITIIYKGENLEHNDMFVYLFNDAGGAVFHAKPGDAMKIVGTESYGGKTFSIYKLTIKASDLGENSYKYIRFYNVYNNSGVYGNWKTNDTEINISQTNSKGKSYTFRRPLDAAGWDTDHAVVNKEADGTADSSSIAEKKPLYLGNFLARISNNPTSEPNANQSSTSNGKDNDSPNAYDTNAKNNVSPSINNNNSHVYNNFYWQANISQRPVTLDGTKQDSKASAAIQGLVDNSLTGGVISQNSNKLPYFDSSWSGVESGYMKCWESTNANPISFPFYELLQETVTSGQYARYYQFNSKDSTLLFHESDGTDAHPNAYFTERKPATNINADGKIGDGGQQNQSVRAATGTIGYFPFNEVDANNSKPDSYDGTGSGGKKNNYGFGTMFQMTFKLKPDGKVDAVDSNGDTIRDGATKVDTLFEFTGDDDLWVFIDDNLVLDMGGSHAASSGRINFASGTATVDNAITYGTGGVDNLGVVGSTKTVDIKSLLNKGYLVVEDTEANRAIDSNHVQNDLTKPLRSGYDPEEVHTMKIFYMERGMSESNLFIRFNFPAEPNYSKLKVKEQTDFSGINAGLKDLTKKAADVDVFRYLIENNGTKNDDVLRINAVYPTKENYIRTVSGTTTKLTSSTTSSPEQKSYYFQPGATVDDKWHKVAGVSYNWVDERALKDGTGDQMKSQKNVGGITSSAESPSTDNGYMYLMYGTPAEGATDEIKSSGEFEGQFARYSLLRVTQDNDLYTPNTHATDGAAAALNTIRYTTPRTVSEYYNETRRYIFSGINTDDTFDITPGQPFNFRNNIVATSDVAGGYTYLVGDSTTNKDANEQSPVAMTAQFVNAPKTGALSITKAMASGVTSDQEFTIKVRFEDIFGTDVDADVAGDYNDIVYNRYNDDDSTRNLVNAKLTAGTVTAASGAACGTFKIKAGEIVTIENIPYKTKFTVYEEMDGYTATITPNSGTGTISEGRINASHKAETLTGTEIDANNITVTNTPDDENTLKIKEITNFDNVNAGLTSLTRQVADSDVFKYTISNQNTTSQGNSGYKYPTYDKYVRNNTEAATAQQTTLTYHSKYVYLNTSQILSEGKKWSSDEAKIGAYVYKDKVAGKHYTVLGTKVGDDLYRFQIEFNGEVYGNVVFKRFSNTISITEPMQGEYKGENNTDQWNYSSKHNGFAEGSTYKITGWDNSSLLDDDDTAIIPRAEDYEYYNFNPNNGNAVKDTTYLWTDGFSGRDGSHYDNFDYMTNKTDGSGNFYLMYGTAASDTNKESSALFLKQFTRGSTMTVVQGDTLTSPNGGNPDTLQKTNNRGSGNDTVATYYSLKKELSGAGASSDGVLEGNIYAYTNDGGAISIVETFTNTVNVGAISVTKSLNNNDNVTQMANGGDEFEYTLTLDNVFGSTGTTKVGVSDYSGITIGGDAISINGDGKLTSEGKFKLKAGQTATIYGIPVGTTYTLTESDSTNYHLATNGANNNTGTVKKGVLKEGQSDYSSTSNYDPHADNQATFTNTRKKGKLVLSKTVQGAGNAPSGSTSSYIFKVTLTEPAGVTFINNYTITNADIDSEHQTSSGTGPKTYTFYKTITSPSYSLEITGIPYGTEYTVEEVYLSGGDYLPVAGAANMQPVINPPDGTISNPQTDANVTNTYRKVVLTKKDSADSSKGVNGATYYLLKLNDGINESNSAAVTAFANAAHYNDAGITQYYSSCSSTCHTTNNGTITIRDTDMTNGLTPGNYFFFEESAPSTGYYLRDNTLSDTKIINIPATPATPTDENLSFSITYTDERKKGSLELEKLLAAGTDSKYSAGGSDEQSFTFDVELDGANTDGTGDHLNLDQYGITLQVLTLLLLRHTTAQLISIPERLQ